MRQRDRAGAGGGPDWIGEAVAQARAEVTLFVATAVAFTLRPGRFAVEWEQGERRALNPLGFLATAFAVVAPVLAVYHSLTRAGGDEASLGRAALSTVLPFGYYLLLGTLQHATLRLFGSRRPWRDSCAMTLYAGGGPGTAAHLLVAAGTVCFFLRTGRTWIDRPHTALEWLAGSSALVSFALFCVPLGAALRGLHGRDGIRTWHVVVANVCALVASGLLFGWLRPPGQFGLHVIIDPRVPECSLTF